LGYCGHRDWRLANIRELASLVHAGVPDQSLWLSSLGFRDISANQYWWSSTSLIAMANYAWKMSFPDTIVNLDTQADNDFPKSNALFGWQVRTASAICTACIPRTGQTACFDAAGTAIPCPGTGQDGDFMAGVAWPSPRFSDNADGTITDNLTGLIWLKDANCLKTKYPAFDQEGTPGEGKVTWSKTLEFIAGINSTLYPECGGGQTDWRLPNYIELQSLIDFSASLPALPAGHPFSNVETGYYWTSTTRANTPLKAWVIGLWDGRTLGLSKSYPSTLPLWPVRGGQ
jgi:hypothetical protein